MKKLLFIVGPTASGKSDFAVKAAKKLNTEIISADSMQIYKHMDIGTAKIKNDEMHGIKHHFIDIIEPTSEFSVADYKNLATPIIDNLLNNNKTPIMCGGTGLYFNSIIFPLNFSKTSKDIELRNNLKNNLNEFGAEYMYNELAKIDPSAAEKININDTKRVIRALEINISSGGKKNELEIKKPSCDYLMIGFNPKRELLYNRINERVNQMFNNGLIDEVKSLLSNGISFDCQSMQAIGYKEFKAFFNNEINEEKLRELIKQHTRNYAKRQITWFKKYPNIVWFESPSDEALNLIINTF